uniref:Uncharacterized protein n=1 Tax=Arundo donax TaxID=35708 RepID=A0A0A9GVX1_ARUDO
MGLHPHLRKVDNVLIPKIPIQKDHDSRNTCQVMQCKMWICPIFSTKSSSASCIHIHSKFSYVFCFWLPIMN